MSGRARVANALLRRHASLSRLLPRGYHAYPGPGGWIYLDLRESPMMLARALRVYEPAKVRALRAVLRPGVTFVDVGGNKGDFALIAARSMGGVGRVLCVEPEPTNAEWIRRSAARNHYGCVEVVEAALAEYDGEATLHLGAKSGWHTLVDDPSRATVGELVVQTRSLDALLRERDIECVDVIKIDVEGAEDRVLDGASGAFGGAHSMTVLLDLHPPRVDAVAICRRLEAWGFALRQPGDVTQPLAATATTAELVAIR